VRTVFVDTGAWIALLEGDDMLHEGARAYYEAHVASRDRLLTTNYVVDESATRLRYDAGLEAAMLFRRTLDEAMALGRLRTAWIDQRLEREAWNLLERYADVELSLTDATSAVVARRARVSEVFGFDGDFRALGFDVQPATAYGVGH
jgi:predicted nucleic acid-binding protein